MGNLCECQRPPAGVGTDRLKAEEPRADGRASTATSVLQLTEDDLDESSDDQADVVEDLPKPSAKTQMKNRQSVSAEAYGDWNKKTDFTAPVYPKTEEQKHRIQDIVESSFLFSCLDVEDIEVVLGAFQEVSVKEGDTLIHQGADGDRLYLIEEGEAEVFKKLGDSGEPVKVNLMKAGDTVGELALMYNAPRAATVIATTDLKLWSLDRLTFTHIVRDAAAKKREMFEGSLKEVKLLKDVDPYERSKVADALKTITYQAGDDIIKEGEEGDTFYMLLEGEAEALKGGQVVMEYKPGSYFGELALLKNQPRAATVRAKTACKLAFMDRKSFKRLLGPLETLLMRNQDHYRQVMNQLGLDTHYLDK